MLAGLRPVWLPAEIDERFGIPTGVSPATVEQALTENPSAVALFCVEPGYLGTLSDLPATIALAHEHGVPVVVDQAWGAHLGFHPGYPPHALALGADAMVLSAHKTLPAYSQASVVAACTATARRGPSRPRLRGVGHDQPVRHHSCEHRRVSRAARQPAGA